MSLLDKYGELKNKVQGVGNNNAQEVQKRLDWLLERLNECLLYENISEAHLIYLEQYFTDTFRI
jgi:hypothetical protein